MIIHTGFELAANRRNFSGVTGQVCAWRGFRRPRPSNRSLNARQPGNQQLKRVERTLIKLPLRDRFSSSRNGPDDSRPIGRTIVERFSPTRF